MKYFTKNPLLVCLFILSGLLTIQALKPSSASAAYDGGRIIDNSVFLDSKSMSMNDVQNFLSSKGGQIATKSFVLDCDGAGTQAKQAYLSLGAPCGQSAPASNIIYYAAQVYGISPKVVLATLQKEQSLVTAVNPTDRQYAQAMGYACPTSGSCSDTSNFFYQIDNGTWVLRFHMERARGNNNWWYTSTTWTCGTAKNFYKPNLYPNQDVDFYDEDGVYYRKHYIANAATSSMYCYTPHAYNNPQGLYGRVPYGTTGRYYSGSYNFVFFFETWFGTTSANAYEARVVSQSAYPTLFNGESKTVSISYANQGFARWYDDTSVPAGGNPVHLAATKNINRSSIFSTSWPSAGRATSNFTRVYESDGVTLASNQHAVEPSQIAVFEFQISTSNNIAPGTYREHFQPVLEGASNWNMGGVAWLDISIVTPYKAEFYNQSSYPILPANTRSAAFIMYKNTGTAYWYDDLTAPTNNTSPVRLATAGPVNRESIFSASWLSSNRATGNFAVVYLADGTTQSQFQHVVRPGEIVKFEFNLTATDNLQPGFYRERFQPVLDGTNNWFMGGLAWLDITTNARMGGAQFVSQSPFATATPGQQKAAFIRYRNNSNAMWYDSQSATRGLLPVNLATTAPINRYSAFSFGWPSNSRPKLSFSAVYESDNVTLASNQHQASPGQVVSFEFTLTVPWTYKNGTYREYFQPLVEGSPNWNIGGVSWLDTTVQQ